MEFGGENMKGEDVDFFENAPNMRVWHIEKLRRSIDSGLRKIFLSDFHLKGGFLKNQGGGGSGTLVMHVSW